jgi:hypothetical protein
MHSAQNGYTRTVRRFFSRVAVYFGLKDDDAPAPAPERPTWHTVVAVVVASIVVGLLADALKAAVSSSGFDLTHALWHGASLSVLMVILRFVEYHVRSSSDAQRRQSDPSASA